MSADTASRKFDKFFRNLVQQTCREWDYEIPQAEYFVNVCERLPLGLRQIIESGL